MTTENAHRANERWRLRDALGPMADEMRAAAGARRQGGTVPVGVKQLRRWANRIEWLTNRPPSATRARISDANESGGGGAEGGE